MTFLAALPLVELVELAWQSTLKATGVPLVEQDTLGLFIHAAPAMRATLLFFAVALAPVTEELVFRGVLFRYVRGRAPRWLALAGPALLFAALHQNLASLAGLFTLGLCFSLAYERTGDLRVPIVAHGLFNLHTALLVFAGVTK